MNNYLDKLVTVTLTLPTLKWIGTDASLWSRCWQAYSCTPPQASPSSWWSCSTHSSCNCWGTLHCYVFCSCWSNHLVFQIASISLDARPMLSSKTSFSKLLYHNHMKRKWGSLSHFNGSNFHSLLPTYLEIFSQNFEQDTEVTFPANVDFFCNCSAAQVSLMSEVSKLVQLLLVMPTTNAQSERSFSAVWRLKTYLHSSVTQQH